MDIRQPVPRHRLAEHCRAVLWYLPRQRVGNGYCILGVDGSRHPVLLVVFQEIRFTQGDAGRATLHHGRNYLRYQCRDVCLRPSGPLYNGLVLCVLSDSPPSDPGLLAAPQGRRQGAMGDGRRHLSAQLRPRDAVSAGDADPGDPSSCDGGRRTSFPLIQKTAGPPYT